MPKLQGKVIEMKNGRICNEYMVYGSKLSVIKGRAERGQINKRADLILIFHNKKHIKKPNDQWEFIEKI